MRRVVAFVCLIGAAGFAPAPFPKPGRVRADPDQADLAAMQGTWRVKSQSIDGRAVSADGWRLVVAGSRMRYLTPRGEVNIEYDVALDARARLKTMDLFVGGVRDEKSRLRGVYVFRGGELRTCFPYSVEHRADRPPACEPGRKWIFEIFERVSP